MVACDDGAAPGAVLMARLPSAEIIGQERLGVLQITQAQVEASSRSPGIIMDEHGLALGIWAFYDSDEACEGECFLAHDPIAACTLADEGLLFGIESTVRITRLGSSLFVL
jgi:hypothetical protein